MYAVFKRADAGSDFTHVGFWNNIEDDIWLKATMNALGLVEANTRIVKFNQIEFKEVMNYSGSQSENEVIGYDDINDRIQYLIVTKASGSERKFIEYDDANAIDYYAQSEIDEHLLASAFWNDETRDFTVNPATQEEIDQYVLIPSRQFDIPDQPESVEMVAEVQGIEMDIALIIANEESALA